MKFNLKLQSVCATDDLRPAMQHILFHKEWIVCTNEHIIAIVNIADLDVSDEEKEIFMTFENKLLHKKAFQKIWNKFVIVKNDGFECPSEYVTVKFSDDDTSRFPNWRKIIGDFKDKSSFNNVGLSARLLNLLCDALPGCKNTGQVSLYIVNPSKGITVFPKDNKYKSYGLIMPVMTDEINPVLNEETMLFNLFKNN